jgi:hypothetical protein
MSAGNVKLPKKQFKFQISGLIFFRFMNNNAFYSKIPFFKGQKAEREI